MEWPVNCSDLELLSYLQALEEGYLVTYYSDTKQSAQLKSMDIASRCFQQGKKMALFHGFQSLQMSKNSTDDLGEELLTWYLEGFRARTYPSQEKEQELMESDQDSGEKWLGWLAKFDPHTCSWKTAQLSLLGDSEKSLETFPRSGMTRGGLLWELPMLELRTEETDFGCLLPTPVASDIGHRKTRYAQGGMALSMAVGGRVNPEYEEWMMGWKIGMSGLKPLETDKFPNAEQQHGELLEGLE